MASRTTEGVEILIHISAPSSGKDDEHYRALASGFLAFEPFCGKGSSRDSSEDVVVVTNRESESSLQDEARVSQHEEEQRPRIPIFDDGDESYQESPLQAQSSLRKTYLTRSYFKGSPLASPQASFGSVLDGAGSPDIRNQAPVRGSGPGIAAQVSSGDGWTSSPSEVPDSQPSFQFPTSNFSSPTHALELYLQQLPASRANADGSLRSRTIRNGSLGPSSQKKASTTDLAFSSSLLMSHSFAEQNGGSDTMIRSSAPVARRHSSSNRSGNEDVQIPSVQAASTSPNLPGSRRCCQSLNSVPLPDCPACSKETMSYQKGPRKSDGDDSALSNPLPISAVSSWEGLLLHKEVPISGMSKNFTHSFTANNSTPHISIDGNATTSLIPQKRKCAHQGTPTPHLSSPPAIINPFSKPRSTSQDITSTTIRPPPPPTSTSTAPLIVLTPSLLKLASTLGLRTRYRPISQSRPLRPLERGYWDLCTETWGDDVRNRAWSALGVYVGHGRAGWGVWCTKEADATIAGVSEAHHHEQNEIRTVEGDDDCSRIDKDWRIYCWGDVVGYIYLLLYLVSERRVKGTGAKWLDGGGKVVVSMEKTR